MARILGGFGAVLLAVLAGWTAGDSWRWLIDHANAQVGGWSFPVRASNLGNTVVPILNGRGAALTLLQCTASTNTAYVQVFDVAANNLVTLNTTVPVLSFAVNGMLTVPLPSGGIAFGSGIQIAATTTATGAAASNATVDCNLAHL